MSVYKCTFCKNDCPITMEDTYHYEDDLHGIMPGRVHKKCLHTHVKRYYPGSPIDKSFAEAEGREC